MNFEVLKQWNFAITYLEMIGAWGMASAMRNILLQELKESQNEGNHAS